MKFSNLSALALFVGCMSAPALAWAQQHTPAPNGTTAPTPPETPPTQPPATTPAPAPVPAPAVETHIKPAPPAPPVVRHVTTPVVVSGIISAAAIGAGVVFAVMASGEHRKYTEQPNHDVGLAGERAAFIADVSFGVGALFGLTALALYMLPDEPTPAEPAKASRARRAPWIAAFTGELFQF